MQLVKLNPYQVKVKIKSFANEHLVGTRHCIKPWDKAATAARERNLGSPIASLKACPAKFCWVKRKAAVHGTREWQKLEAKSCGYDQGIKIEKDICSADKWGWCRGVIKTNSEMKHPGIQLVPSREILCHMLRDWGLHKYVLCSCFQPCLQIYFTLWTSLSSTNTSCSLLPQDLCTW